MRCLIIKNDGIGDLVLSSGVIAQVARQFDVLDLVTCAQNREIAERIPGVRDVYYLSRDALRFAEHPPGVMVAQDIGSLVRLAGQTYDVALCLRRFIRQSTLVAMRCVTAARRHCCWQLPTNLDPADAARASSGWEHYHGPRSTLSELEYLRGFCAHALGTPFGDVMPALRLSDLRAPVARGQRAVAVGLSEGSVPLVRGEWVSFVRDLVGLGWEVHLFGGAEQRGFAAELGRTPGVTDHTGALSWTATLETLRGFPVYVGNDTGLSHVAALVVPKVLVVLGGGTFGRFFPWPGARGQYALFYGMECYDCGWSCKYESRRCLERVRAGAMLERFLAVAARDDAPALVNLGEPLPVAVGGAAC